jgi:CRISPR-associated protein Cas2
MYIILVYDIIFDDGGQKVLRNIFKICKKYLSHIQNSVFEGEMSGAQLKKLELELGKWIRKDIDSLIVFKSRDERWLKKEFWGRDDDVTSNFF